MIFNKLKIYNFLLFQLSLFFVLLIIGILSRFKNIFHLERKDILEHILSGFGLSALFTIILFSILIFTIAIYFNKINKTPKTNFSFTTIALLGMFLSFAKTIMWEFFNSDNTVNQFEYDIIGILLYFVVICYFYSKEKLYVTANKTLERNS